MPEIRAGGVSETVLNRYEDLKTYLGTNTHTSTMEALVNLAWLQYCSSNWVDVRRKAALLVSSHENFVAPLTLSDIKQVLIKDGVVCVWARHQGEPYKLPLKIWEEGQ